MVLRRYKEFLDETRNLSQQNEREKKKVDISDRRNKEEKGNITKYNQLVREGYYEIQHWSGRKTKLCIINNGNSFRKTVEKSKNMLQLDESIQSLEGELKKMWD